MRSFGGVYAVSHSFIQYILLNSYYLTRSLFYFYIQIRLFLFCPCHRLDKNLLKKFIYLELTAGCIFLDFSHLFLHRKKCLFLKDKKSPGQLVIQPLKILMSWIILIKLNVTVFITFREKYYLDVPSI